MKEKNIVILGGGFGGVRVALNLEKSLGKERGYRIILMDQNTFHLYTPSLYEVAAGELSHRCVLLPFHKIFGGKKVKFLNSIVTQLNPSKKLVKTDDGDEITYWKLILALGSDTEDFGIPGVAEYAIGLKSVTDAEKVHEHLLHCAVTKGKPINVVIGGGGFTGVEVAGELTGYKQCPLNITMVEGAPRILAGLPEKISKTISRRLNFLGVRIITSSPIKKAEPGKVILGSGRELPYDVLLWTAGVRGSRFLDSKIFPLDKKKALQVNKHLQVKGFKDIFALGDLASTGVAWTATKAEEDGKVVAYNIAAAAKGGEMREYRVFEPPFIIPGGKRWAIAKVGSLIFGGRLAAILKDFVLLYYLLTILPVREAFRVWWGGACEILEIRSPRAHP
ncbi:MAG: hypothetical protein BMS9Abin34_300 [Patescibacteria group bacterium]|nr:MAG: hypothetical protein BMS9Abin34_300 [Patescibacteria group bacterium]